MREVWIVVRLQVPPSYLVDSCAGGTWSDDEDSACEYPTEEDAIVAVLAADLFAHADYGELWEVQPCLRG